MHCLHVYPMWRSELGYILNRIQEYKFAIIWHHIYKIQYIRDCVLFFSSLFQRSCLSANHFGSFSPLGFFHPAKSHRAWHVATDSFTFRTYIWYDCWFLGYMLRRIPAWSLCPQLVPGTLWSWSPEVAEQCKQGLQTDHHLHMLDHCPAQLLFITSIYQRCCVYCIDLNITLSTPDSETLLSYCIITNKSHRSAHEFV